MFASLRRLLPTGDAWRAAYSSAVRKLLDGISPAFERAREFCNSAYLDLFPGTTRELTEWEAEFGVYPRQGANEATRRAVIAHRMADLGGQSPSYLQSVIDAAGFAVTVSECWESTSPFVARDPREVTQNPRIGTHRCGNLASRCGAPTARCNGFLQNETGYWQMLRWTGEPPSPIPDDEAFWPFFIYIDGTSSVPPERWREFQWLIEANKPARHWVVYGVAGGIFDLTFSPEFE